MPAQYHPPNPMTMALFIETLLRVVDGGEFTIDKTLMGGRRGEIMFQDMGDRYKVILFDKTTGKYNPPPSLPVSLTFEEDVRRFAKAMVSAGVIEVPSKGRIEQSWSDVLRSNPSLLPTLLTKISAAMAEIIVERREFEESQKIVEERRQATESAQEKSVPGKRRVIRRG